MEIAYISRQSYHSSQQLCCICLEIEDYKYKGCSKSKNILGLGSGINVFILLVVFFVCITFKKYFSYLNRCD